MRFLLIRHGQSANNARPEAERVHDPSITELGTLQAESVARRLAELPLTRIITSPFRRTLQTAWPSIQATGLPARVWIETHERGGCYRGYRPGEMLGMPGMNREEIDREFPGLELPTELNHEGWWRSQNRESDARTRQRAERLGERIIAEFAGSNEFVAFFTHADFKMTFATEVPEPHGEVIACPGNGSFSLFEVEAGRIQLRRFNDTRHIAAEHQSA
jgi:2,3-bisphosphoglycerate-dependent phosphoglycerate mutase